MRKKASGILKQIFSLIFVLATVFSAVSSGADSGSGAAADKKFGKIPEGSCLLALNGTCLFRIILPVKAPMMTRYAAKELADYLEKVTGSRAPVITEDTRRWFAGPGKLNIYLGKCRMSKKIVDFEKLRPDAFSIIIDKNKVVIAGRDLEGEPPAIRGFYRKAYDPASGLSKYGETGTLYGVYYFLKKYCHIRWYMPGEVGEVVPESPTLLLPPGKETRAPHYTVRTSMMGIFNIDPDYARWYRRAGLGCVNDDYISHGLHTFGYDRTHPEFLAVKKNGKRDNLSHGTSAYCLTNPEFRKQLVKDIRARFDKDPGLKMISVMPNDHFGPPPSEHFCYCPNCMKQVDDKAPQKGKLSNLVWGFVNDIAKEVYKTHPDRLIGCLAYSYYVLPPSNLKTVSPNLTVGLVISGPEYSWSEKLKGEINKVRDFWKDKTKNLCLWVNDAVYYDMGTYGIPLFNWKAACRLVKDFAPCSSGYRIALIDHYTANVVTEPVYSQHKGFNHLPLYMLGEVLWDPSKDPEKLFTEYLDNFYGPASGSMRKFFTRCDEVWNEGNIKYNADVDPDSKAYKCVNSAWQLYTPQVVNELLAYLDEAEKGSTGIYRQRVCIVKRDVGNLMNLQRSLIDGKKQAEYHSKVLYTEKPPEIDGLIDDECWKDSGHLEFVNRLNSRKPFEYTRAMLRWDNDNIYVAVQSVDAAAKYYPDLYKKMPLSRFYYRMEGFEVDIMPPDFSEKSCRMLLSESGPVYYMLILKSDKTGDGKSKQWGRGKVKTAVHRGKGSIAAEIAIPFECFGVKASAGETWGFNVGRRQNMHGQRSLWRSFSLSSWVPVCLLRNWIYFGGPEDLGKIEFTK